MRITADVDVANRLLPSFNMSSNKGKAAHAQLSVGRKPGDASKDGEVFLMVCTKLDRNGAKYRLKGNLQHMFTRFVMEGKATLRFHEPPHDLCLSKADPVQLKGLLSVVRMAAQGKGMDKITLSSLAPASAKQVEKLKTKMSITKRVDYPVTTNFPHSLEVLIVSQLSLKKIDSRMLKLRRLRVLDLSHNSIKLLPGSFDLTLALSELHLSGNQLEEIPKEFCQSSLQNTLTCLDVSYNRLKILRPYVAKLQALVTLKVDHNQIVCLPQNLGTLMRLRIFTASHNQLKTLPASFTQLRLETLDLFENQFLQAGAETCINRLQFPTLLEVAARAIKKLRIPYTEEDVGPLLDYLNSAKTCLCGQPCFRSHVHFLAGVDLHRVTASVTAIDQSGRTRAPCEAFLCSQHCLDIYKKNPNATIWRS